MKTAQSVLAIIALGAFAGTSLGGAINSVKMVNRLFNDFPDSTLVATNNYPSSVSWSESNFDPFGDGGNFANRHTAYFSADGGATANDFNYTDGFDASFDLNLTSANPVGREAGFHADLFGLGFFGVLPNGEIAAFGSILPFKTFGTVWTPGQAVSLRMILTPGDGNGQPGNTWTIPSTIEYIYDLGSGPVSSGQIPFTNGEGGVPSPFPFFVGFGAQNVGSNDTPTSAVFTNIKFANVAPVPTPGAASLLGLAGLVGLRRRR